jgi:hypothetical protein
VRGTPLRAIGGKLDGIPFLGGVRVGQTSIFIIPCSIFEIQFFEETKDKYPTRNFECRTDPPSPAPRSGIFYYSK